MKVGELTKTGTPRRACGAFKSLPREEQLRLTNERSRKYRKIFAEENPEAHRAMLAAKKVKRLADYHKHKEAGSEKYYAWLAQVRDAKYGLVPGQWDAMLIAQSGRCDICNKPMRSPQVDHDHDSGKVRGLLCVDCNTGLGGFRDSRPVLLEAISYLSRHGR